MISIKNFIFYIFSVICISIIVTIFFFAGHNAGQKEAVQELCELSKGKYDFCEIKSIEYIEREE